MQMKEQDKNPKATKWVGNKQSIWKGTQSNDNKVDLKISEKE